MGSGRQGIDAVAVVSRQARPHHWHPLLLEDLVPQYAWSVAMLPH
jgi:hypothetical protein